MHVLAELMFATRRDWYRPGLDAGGDNIIVVAWPPPVGHPVPPAVQAWIDTLPDADLEALVAARQVLRDLGPSLGRPLVDSVVASRHSNMKELRPGSTGRSEIRVLFAFDVVRRAVLLVGGDKSSDWKGWYVVNIPIADDRFTQHQQTLQQAKTKQTKGRRR